MTSPFAILFLAIQPRLAQITTGSPAVPVFNFIDQDLGQLEDASKGINRPPVAWPCALIDIDDANYTNMGENVQDAVVNVCLRIGFPPFSSTELNVPAPYRNKALYYYDLEQAVIDTFQGWSATTVIIDDTTSPVTTADLSDTFGHFIRVRISKEDRNDLLRVRCIMFTLGMTDYSTLEESTFIPASVNLTTTIQIPT
jgi:hypothetical protein